MLEYTITLPGCLRTTVTPSPDCTLDGFYKLVQEAFAADPDSKNWPYPIGPLTLDGFYLSRRTIGLEE